jgi:hypothetical protein
VIPLATIAGPAIPAPDLEDGVDVPPSVTGYLT